MNIFYTQHFLSRPLMVASWLVEINRYFTLYLETNGTNDYMEEISYNYGEAGSQFRRQPWLREI